MESFDGIMDRLDIRPTGDGSLSGLTFAVKDMFDLQGRTASFGNPDWKRTHKPAERNAPVIDQLLAAGAHLLYNACADELACSLDGINEHYGVPLNPQDVDRIPGGSSSGSASLVAREEVDFALGTDTAGSVRVPASYCGIFGLRPTHDAIDATGVVPLGPSFDTVGILARSAEMIDRVAQVLLKSASTDESAPTTLILPDQFDAALDPLIAPYMMSFVEALKTRFAQIKYINLYRIGREVYDVFSTVRAHEAWNCHKNWLESAKPQLSNVIRQRIYACRDVSEDAFRRAAAARADLLAKSSEIVDANSVICLPTTWNIPPLKTAGEGELQDNRNRNISITTIASCYGFPQISIPIPTGRMKLGVSLMGAKGSDRALLKLARELTE